MTRQCGDCQLCCKLLPVRELSKGANSRCQYQRRGKGCTVYHKPEMPFSCRMWNCRWLLGDRTENLSRPDRSGYVLDVMPDFVTARDNVTGKETHIPVLQVWVDPARPGAWKNDPALIAYIERLAREDGMATIVRNGSVKATTVIAPSLDKGGQWHFITSGVVEETHTPEDYVKAGFGLAFSEVPT